MEKTDSSEWEGVGHNWIKGEESSQMIYRYIAYGHRKQSGEAGEWRQGLGGGGQRE